MICTEYDGFMGDSTIWIAQLNDGQTVYMDDGRPGLERSSWLRLKQYCEDNKKIVTGLQIKFRDHVESLPNNKDGYFFSLGSLGVFGNKEREIYQQFVTGYEENGKVHITKWIVPEIIIEYQEVREIEKCLHGLISKTSILQNIQTD